MANSDTFYSCKYGTEKKQKDFFFISRDPSNLIIVNLFNENQFKFYNWYEPKEIDSKWYNAIMIQT